MPESECKGCGKCCIAFEIGSLTGEEATEKGLEVYEDHLFSGDFHVKKHRPDWLPKWGMQGACIYLTRDMKCSIYDRRPELCKEFYCREDGKLTSHYHRVRRAVSRPERWTDYEWEAFGHFLTEAEKGKLPIELVEKPKVA